MLGSVHKLSSPLVLQISSTVAVCNRCAVSGNLATRIVARLGIRGRHISLKLAVVDIVLLRRLLVQWQIVLVVELVRRPFGQGIWIWSTHNIEMGPILIASRP